ncbi:CoA transferase [Phytohabitans sp. ZYX-F-186]|uniref:CoA transferase n=1 Tax=Phytohabitans maris TaxID=3071409 RepID=A0ABU0ZEZ2_9ACTN|nr:CoA transferase [Phytohabitans sp. ZYX-F-186]MDQ7905543.1 CoA transferase [Phytohabitans sp. ZYX-F-186]
MSEHAGPVRGTKVLVLGRGLPIDCASMFLADLGADVVMVEEPGSGPATDDVAPAIDGLGYQRLAFCRNKRSVALRAGDAAEREAIHRLLDWADVVLYDSANPIGRDLAGTLGEVATRRTELITCDGSTWGSFGERAGWAGDDLVLQASAGCMDLTGEADDPPTRAGASIFDFVSGTYIAIAVLAAVFRRQRAGAGQRIEVAGYDTAVTLLSNMASAYFATGEHRSRLGTGHISIFPYNAFRTSDGEIVIAIFTQAFWSKFCAGIGRADLLENPRYKTIPDRMRAKDELSAILDELFLRRTTDEWSEILREADVPYGPVLPVGRALSLDQTTHRGMTPALTGLSRPVRTVGSPLRFLLSDGSTYHPPARRAPRAGEHDLASILSTSDTQLESSGR